MGLNYRQRYQLRLVRAGMRRSDPLLCAMFGMFGRLYLGGGHARLGADAREPRP